MWVIRRPLAEIAGSNSSGAWMPVSWDCCVLSGRVLYIGPITRPEEFYRAWSVWMWSWILDCGEALTQWGLYIDPWKKIMSYSVIAALCDWLICWLSERLIDCWSVLWLFGWWIWRTNWLLDVLAEYRLLSLAVWVSVWLNTWYNRLILWVSAWYLIADVASFLTDW
jgi:hypothetical protein